MPAPAAPLATATRRDVRTGRDVVESRHVGHLVVVDGDGAVVAELGDGQRPTFLRSTVKPFQATGCLELLDAADPPAAARPDLDEVAIGWASHRGEPSHLDAVRRLLDRAGVAPEQLTCPADRTLDTPEDGVARLHHNCSGKHALFALTAAVLDLDPGRLLDVDGPLQPTLLAAVADAVGPASAIGTDGCGAPAVETALAGLARGFAALAAGGRWSRPRDAGLAHPQLVGGRDRLETALLASGTVAKSGAEGVFAAGWTAADGRRYGLAAKAEDGAGRAVTTAVAGLLAAADRLPAGAWSPPPVLGGGRPAGSVHAAADVVALAEALPR